MLADVTLISLDYHLEKKFEVARNDQVFADTAWCEEVCLNALVIVHQLDVVLLVILVVPDGYHFLC